MAIKGTVTSVTKPNSGSTSSSAPIQGTVTSVTRGDGSTYYPATPPTPSSPYGKMTGGASSVRTPSYTGGGAYSPSPTPAYNPAMDAINSVTYWKQAYENAQKAGKGAESLKYITNQAQGAYGQLDPQTAQQLKGMNAAQAAAYYRSISGKDNGQGLAGMNNTNAPVQQPIQEQGPSEYDQMMEMLMGYMQGYDQRLNGYQQEMAAFQAQQAAQMKQQMEGLIGQYNQAQDADLAALDREYAEAQAQLEDDSFQQYLNARQAMANRGLAGSGLANDQDTRLLMANSKNLAGLQNSVLNQKAGVKLRYGSQIDNLRNQMAQYNLPLSAGGVEASRAQSFGAPMAPDDTTLNMMFDIFKETLPYNRATVKDQMGYAIDQQDQARKMYELLGYLPDGTLTLDARDKGATQQRLMAELLGYLPDGTLTRQSRKDANDLLMDQIQTYGYDQNGNPTLDYTYKMGQLDQGQQKIDLDSWYKGNVLNQNQQKIDIDSWFKSGTLQQNQQKIEQDWAKVQIQQQNANTRLQELSLNEMKFNSSENRAMYQDQAKAATTIMNSAYKDMQAAATLLSKNKDDQNAQQRYITAKKQYDIALQAVDELAKLDINKGVKEQSKTPTQKKVDQFFNRVTGLLNEAGGVVDTLRSGNGANLLKGVGKFSESPGAYTNYYKAASDSKANPQNYAEASSAIKKAASDLGVPQSWIKPLEELVARESSFNKNAKNPKSTARGLFQFLDGTRKNYGGSKVNWDDPYQQALAGIRYVKDRYGTPEKALAHWDQKKWY